MKLREGSDPEHMGLLKETLRVLFGLEPNTIARVIRTIKSTEDSSDVRTNLVRARIGARAMKYLRNAIEIARHEGTEKHENEKDRDLEKEADLEPEELKQEQDRKKKMEAERQTQTEGLTFKDFLISEREVTVSVDTENPEAARKKLQDVRRNPERANRQSMVDAANEKRDAQQSGDAIAARIAALRMQIKQLEAKQVRLQQQGE